MVSLASDCQVSSLLRGLSKTVGCAVSSIFGTAEGGIELPTDPASPISGGGTSKGRGEGPSGSDKSLLGRGAVVGGAGEDIFRRVGGNAPC